MSKIVQPPKPIEEMTPAERERWEELLEDDETLHSPDVWDSMETLRKLLNSSQIEAMYFIKKQSRFGKACPYYKKAKILFDRDSRAAILSLLDKLRDELREELND
jgi:hypothetical protein